ncbi:threonine aldolase family protein [Penaeicola halotolerans]|uniref:threonine aldolase family protein n=1 Tax=Penaeicola halotolerans TaxID=2793196 RepID=UPI001CF90F40|nr:GntG family PLP-dependent aldolase [Penaeicola halotolerans]
MIIDLRSDTVTKPSKGMLEAMMSASVGDDVYGEDPTVNALEQKAAEMFGMEEALFCPSGTMTNQIAIRLHTQPQTEVICHKYSHIHLYEAGGIAYNSMASLKLLEGEQGKITAESVAAAISPDDVHACPSVLVSLENTMNKGGGSIYQLAEIQAIKDVCEKNGMKLHLDGARLFNALVETGDDPKAYGAIFDTISICLSKGLGCPVGSLLLGSKEDIKRSKRIRKVLGGGMRQAGFLAAAGIYALDHQVDRLKDDHAHARQIGDILKKAKYVSNVMPIATNIVIASLSGITPEAYLILLKEKGVLGVKFGPNEVRFVTHHDIDSTHISVFEDVIKSI